MERGLSSELIAAKKIPPEVNSYGENPPLPCFRFGGAIDARVFQARNARRPTKAFFSATLPPASVGNSCVNL